jgi:hypothetical protein
MGLFRDYLLVFDRAQDQILGELPVHIHVVEAANGVRP